jgi:hypothetical protein
MLVRSDTTAALLTFASIQCCILLTTFKTYLYHHTTFNHQIRQIDTQLTARARLHVSVSEQGRFGSSQYVIHDKRIGETLLPQLRMIVPICRMVTRCQINWLRRANASSSFLVRRLPTRLLADVVMTRVTWQQFRGYRIALMHDSFPAGK